MDNNIFSRVLLYAQKKDYFTWVEMRNDLKLNDNDKPMFDGYFLTPIEGVVTLINRSNPQGNDEKYFLSNLGHKYASDYLALKESRDSAQKAQEHGNLAVQIAVASLFVSIVIGLLQI